MVRHVESEIANAQIKRRFFSKTAAQSADTRNQFLHREWLGQIIIRAKLQTSDTILQLAAGREHQNAARNVARPQAAQDFEPVHSWQPNIEYNQIKRRFRGVAQGGLSIVGHDRVVAGLNQSCRDLSRQSNFIFNNQSAHNLKLIGVAYYRLANILIGGRASNYGKTSIPPLGGIHRGNDRAKVTDVLLFAASFDP
jgi:hypothetical protein